MSSIHGSHGTLRPTGVVGTDLGRSGSAPTTAQIVAVIDMPWGVMVSDVTVRATGEDFVR